MPMSLDRLPLSTHRVLRRLGKTTFPAFDLLPLFIAQSFRARGWHDYTSIEFVAMETPHVALDVAELVASYFSLSRPELGFES